MIDWPHYENDCRLTSTKNFEVAYPWSKRNMERSKETWIHTPEKMLVNKELTTWETAKKVNNGPTESVNLFLQAAPDVYGTERTEERA